MLEIHFTPFPELKTERLLLRRIVKADVPQLFRLRSSSEVMKYIDRERAVNIRGAEIFLGKVDEVLENEEGIAWGISLLENPALLAGYIGYWRLMKEHFRAELGYMLLPEYWKKGYMKEALSKLIPYGFETMKLHSIEARINPANTASAALLTSAGFGREAYFKEDYFFNGSFGDTAVYSRLQHSNA